MSKRGNMAVRPADLENPERDLDLSTRGPRPVAASPGFPMDLLRARIEQAKTIKPDGKQLHCLDCWERGRNAAVKVIEGAG